MLLTAAVVKLKREKTRIFQVLMMPNKDRNAWTWQIALVCNTYLISQWLHAVKNRHSMTACGSGWIENQKGIVF